MTFPPSLIMQTEIKAIPTEYNGHRFRSRLEAKWACFFDNCGWPWEYEALDLEGYIPDFILTLPHAHVLVEVKPVMDQSEFAQHWSKIKQSGWDKEAMIVGARIFKDGDQWADVGVIGSLVERDAQGAWNPAPAIMETCEKCKLISFFHDTDTWRCRVGGCYDGDHYLDPWSHNETRKLFADCGGVVQWNT